MAYWGREFQRVRSPVLRYGFAVVSVVIATAVALLIQEYQFPDVELPLLVLVIGLVTWYAGSGPAVVAVLLSTTLFKVAADDSNPMAHTALGIFELFSGRHEEARRCLRRALKLNPNYSLRVGSVAVSHAWSNTER
jgi:hypothetical protein